jgi:hypothetical protein
MPKRFVFLLLLCCLSLPAWAGTPHPVNLFESLLTTDGPPQLLSAGYAPNEFFCTVDAIATQALPNLSLSEGPSVLVNTVAGQQSQAGNWYRVYRATSSSGPFTLIADCITLGNYLDTTVQSGVTYYYQVTAMQWGVESAPFDQATWSAPVFDTLIAFRGRNATLSTSLTTSDALARLHGYNPAPGESLTTSDSLGRQVGWAQALSESLGTSAGLSAVWLGPNSINFYEDLATSDSITHSGLLARNLTENLSTWAALGDVIGPTLPPAAPFPTINWVDQGMAALGSCAFTLKVIGGNFTPQSVVSWNGGTRQTTYVSSQILQVGITAADLTQGGIFPLTVTNAPGTIGGGKTFAVIAGAPTITASYVLGATLVIDGTNFVPRNTVVLWNGTALATNYFSPTRVQAFLPAGVRAIGGNTVTVSNSGCPAN